MACFMFWLFTIRSFAVLTISTLAAHSIAISILVINIIISYISVQTRIREAEVRIVVLNCIVSVTSLPPPTSALQCLLFTSPADSDGGRGADVLERGSRVTRLYSAIKCTRAESRADAAAACQRRRQCLQVRHSSMSHLSCPKYCCDTTAGLA